MDHDTLLERVETAIDRLIDAGDPHGGLFPSILDRETATLPDALPEQVPGQRNSDRAPDGKGCNPLHDEPILRAMYGLADADGTEEYATAADRYLETFASECARRDHRADGEGTATGLFPWGEHSYWHLAEGRIGNSYRNRDDVDVPHPVHDHLRLVPAWLWEKLYSFEPRCLHDFADGLEYHFYDPEETYNRHAYITPKTRHEFAPDDHACDFPRHGGHYLHDWTVAYTKDAHPEYVRRIRRTLDYWWERRDPEFEGLLPPESYAGYRDSTALHCLQTLSLANSLLDSAELLAGSGLEPDLRETMRERAETYVDGFLAAPHDLEERVFLGTCRERDLREGEFEPLRDAESEITPLSSWGQAYGGAAPAAGSALQALCAFRHTERDGLLAFAQAVGEFYRETPFPAGGEITFEDANMGMAPSTRNTMVEGAESLPVRAGTAGQVLGLYADLYDLTGEAGWLESGFDLAESVVSTYFDAPLPRGASTVEHYENQLGTGYLLYNAARLALLDRDGRDCVLEPDYTDR